MTLYLKKLYQYAPSAQRHEDSNVMRPLTDKMNPSTCAAGYLGRYLIHFSLTDKITHLLPTQPRKCKAEVREKWAAVPSISHTLRKMHGGDSPQTRHVANTFFEKPASLSITRYPITTSHRGAHATAMLKGDKHAASGCTHAPVTACLIFSFSFTVFLHEGNDSVCLSQYINRPHE